MIINPLPPFEYLPAEDIEKIHGLSLKLLAELGLEFLHPEAVSILEAAGAEVGDPRAECLEHRHGLVDVRVSAADEDGERSALGALPPA